MIVWINGAFGAGKTTSAYELHRRLPGSHVYDPENIGIFIRKNAPKPIDDGDFQHLPLWRSFNYEMLKLIADKHAGKTIIVPMTLVDEAYFDEIVGRLRADGIGIAHFALVASRETLLARLRTRGEKENSWGALQIDRCAASLSREKFGRQVATDGLSVDEVVERIAAEAGLALLPDKRSRLRKRWDRLIVKLKHIRF